MSKKPSCQLKKIAKLFVGINYKPENCNRLDKFAFLMAFSKNKMYSGDLNTGQVSYSIGQQKSGGWMFPGHDLKNGLKKWIFCVPCKYWTWNQVKSKLDWKNSHKLWFEKWTSFLKVWAFNYRTISCVFKMFSGFWASSIGIPIVHWKQIKFNKH